MPKPRCLDSVREAKLLALARALIDQEGARLVIPPEKPAQGYWFGGGNLAVAPDGALWLCGRYRNAGDSRTGLDLGDRGRELALFRSEDGGASWRKRLSLGKADLAPSGREVLSIEGSALRFVNEEVELFVSSEKRIAYPESVSDYLKPGTGVWTIERLLAPSVEELAAAPAVTILESADPERLHLKDPSLHRSAAGEDLLFFCHHSFNWSSTNSACMRLPSTEGGAPGPVDFEFLPRGRTWDVAITRVTSVIDLPAIGAFAGMPRVSLVFYDGGECLRSHEEHAAARRRPRGHSCEELGGLAYYLDGDRSGIMRLSPLFPAFVSPWGTGSSRYVSVLSTDRGLSATWQQSQPDRSQALVMNSLSMEEALELLD
jgi:hypothetical protein